MQKRRVTQLDIARQAGVHQATVSLALKNHPSIPAETRRRIQTLAEEMGYQQDPMLSALAAYRNRARPATFHGTLAWLTNTSPDFGWRTSPHYTGYFLGSGEAARKHGYQMEEFDVNGPGMSPRRVASILRARNIAGVLLCPQPKPYTEMEFPWEDFSVITFGYSLLKPRLHTIVTAFYRHMRQTLTEVRRRGYRRIGLALNMSDDQRFDHNVLASYLVDAFLSPSGFLIPPLQKDYRKEPHQLREWLEEHKPEVIVSQDWRVHAVLEKQGVKVPGDVAFACAGIPQGSAELSGIVEDSHLIGEVGADFLISMIQRGERGIPEKTQRVLVEGDWQEGRTLPETPQGKRGQSRKPRASVRKKKS